MAKRWVVLAVLLLGCAAPVGQHRSPDRSPDRAAPAGGEAASPQPTDADIDPDPPSGATPGPTPVGGHPWDERASAACAAALDLNGEPALTEVAQTADAVGVTSFWSAGRRWVACDSVPGEDPVLRAGRPGPHRGFQAVDLVVDAVALDGSTVRLVAAGPLPGPVHQLEYAFPDGHVEAARFVVSDDGSGATWWAMTYTATDGPLADPAAAPEEPLTVSVVGPAAEAFRLPWREATRRS